MGSGSIDRSAAEEILHRAATRSGLGPQISPTGLGAADGELFAYAISPEGRPITSDDPDLIELAAGQVARELIAEVVRRVQAQQRSIPSHPKEKIPVPTTDQPFAQDRPDVRGQTLVGDPRAVHIALGAIELDDISGEADVELDRGGTYNAFIAGGTVIRLRVPIRIEIIHPNLIGVAPT